MVLIFFSLFVWFSHSVYDNSHILFGVCCRSVQLSLAVCSKTTLWEMQVSHLHNNDKTTSFELVLNEMLCVYVDRIPENNLPYCHKRPQVRMLLLSAFCIGVSVTWGVFRNEDQ